MFNFVKPISHLHGKYPVTRSCLYYTLHAENNQNFCKESPFSLFDRFRIGWLWKDGLVRVGEERYGYIKIQLRDALAVRKYPAFVLV